MDLRENILLAGYTTLKIGGPARFFSEARTEDELVELVRFAKTEKRRMLILGEGTNILIADVGFSGVVVKIEITGKKVISEDESSLTVTVNAGEIWDEFVDWAVSKDLYGIENLSAIPGTVGAAPIQNIGAYGAEASNTIMSVRVFDTVNMRFTELSNAQCRFAYRESIFKKDKSRYIVTAVTFKLAKQGKLNIDYKDLYDYFNGSAVHQPAEGSNRVMTPKEVRDAVIDIRWGKLPDWKKWGTAGSFFKNPIISAKRYESIKKKYPNIPGYPEPDGRVKVSAAWLLENVCKAKGLMEGNVGMYKNQALVLVTTPGATAGEVVQFATRLIDQIEHETSIKLEAEVEWVN
jgi:UDP-N-acetylmuramate dehydrogenase